MPLEKTPPNTTASTAALVLWASKHHAAQSAKTEGATNPNQALEVLEQAFLRLCGKFQAGRVEFNGDVHYYGQNHKIDGMKVTIKLFKDKQCCGTEPTDMSKLAVNNSNLLKVVRSYENNARLGIGMINSDEQHLASSSASLQYTISFIIAGSSHEDFLKSANQIAEQIDNPPAPAPARTSKKRKVS